MDSGKAAEIVKRHLTHSELYEAILSVLDGDIEYERGGRSDKSDVWREIRETLRKQDRIEAMEKIRQRLVSLHDAGMNELNKQV